MSGVIRRSVQAYALLSAVAAASAEAADIPAQTPAPVVEEITVTARRREENLQETPVSVSAFSAASLEKLSVSALVDVGQFAPNVVASSGQAGGGDANFFIRGIGQADWFGTVDPGVAVYIDGIYQGRSVGGNLDVTDIARIEILKGPQGTLFGRNAIGGAVNIVTVLPQNELGGRMKLELGERNHRGVQASIDIPLAADTLLSRFSIVAREQDGYVRRVVDEQTHFAIDEQIARASLYWTPAERFSAQLVGDYKRGRGTSPGIINRQINTSYTTPIGVSIPPAANLDRSDDPYLSFSGADPAENLDAWGLGLTLTWRIGDALTLKSLSSYRDLDNFVSLDPDGTRFVIYDLIAQAEQSQFSQELQLNAELLEGRLDLTAGLYYFEEEIDNTNGVTIGGPMTPGPGPSIAMLQRALPENDSQAIFAQGTYRLTDRWSVTAGMRYSYETKHIVYDPKIDNSDGLVSFLPPTVFNFLPPGTAVEKSWSSTTPKLGLEYRPGDDLFFYISWSEGFRSGGFNGKVVPGQTPTSYAPEEVSAFELGWKSEWFANRLRLNGALWHADYQDIQTNAATEAFMATQNAGEAELQGFELELEAVVTDELRINGAVGYTDAKYVKLIPGAIAGGTDISDPLPYTPEWTASFGAEYSFATTSAGDFTLRADWSYVDTYITFPDNPPHGSIEAHSLVNVRLAWQPHGGDWLFAVSGRNILDEFYKTFTQDFSSGGVLGVDNYWPGEPATWLLEATYRF